MPRTDEKSIDRIVRELADGADLDRLMVTHKTTLARMMELMDSAPGREVRKARRRLGRIQRELLANRFSAFAVNKLVAVLQGKKPELWLRAATQLLEAAAGCRNGGEKAHPRSKEEQHVFEIEQADKVRLMHLWTLGLEAEREAARQKGA